MATSPAKDPAKTKRIDDLIKKVRANKGRNPQVNTVVPEGALPKPYTEDQYYRVLASVVLFGTHSWYIGRLDLPPETKVDWDGLQCRNRWIEYTGKLSHPDLDSIQGVVNTCLHDAAVAAIVAGLLTGNVAAGEAAFKASMYVCLSDKGVQWAKEIAIWIDPDQREGDWYYCF